jgi:S1-C subfamily serine protease
LETSTNWAFPEELRPDPSELAFDLDEALRSVVTVHAEIPEDAFTASILGTERVGSGVAIRGDGLILTIGYLITEAESIWITASDGRVIAGHPLAYDFATGFGLVQTLGKLALPTLPRGTVDAVSPGDAAFVLGRGGPDHALKAEVFAKREFAGYWEYLLDRALFTTPLHPEWSGAALVDERGRLVGIGSLFVQEARGGDSIKGNMFVPIDLYTAIEDDLLRQGRANRPARPWLGLYAAEEGGRVVVQGLVGRGPASLAAVRLGDAVTEVAGEPVKTLAEFLRRVWALGPAGTVVPLTIARGNASIAVEIRSGDRDDYLRKPPLQ